MTRLLHRLGSACARRPWRVAAAWLAAIGVLTALSGTVGGAYRDMVTAPDSSSERAAERLRTGFPEEVGASAHIVAEDVSRDDLDAVADTVRAVPHVRDVTSRFSADGRIALLAVRFDVEVPDLDAPTVVDELTSAAAPLGARVAVGGEVPESVQGPNGIAEIAGVVVALALLVLTFGSVLAAALPLLVAAAGLGMGLGLIGLLAAVTEVNSVSPTLGSMLGLGVGIDYGLFVVARHRQALAARLSPVDSAAHATAAAGRSVVLAGLSVLVGITGLAFCGVPSFASMGFASALVVLASVAAAVTLLPAVLAALGPRVFGRRAWRRAERSGTLPADSFHSPRAERLARRVTRRPVVWLVAGVLAVLALAAPALGMRLGQNDAGSEAVDRPTRQAFDLVAEGFGPGENGPLVAVVDRDQVGDARLTALRDQVTTMPGVRAVSPVTESADGGTAVFQIVPTTAPASVETRDLAERLHRLLPTGADLSGPTAVMLDLTSVLSERLWLVVLVVLAATFVLLMLVFRSLVLPAKAVVATLLSVVASYGVMTVLFQTSAGAALIGLDTPVPIVAWAPVVLFAILFGLSMDYEVFLLSSVREQHDAGLPDRESVVRGLGASSKIIVCAAAIMVAVAAGFALDDSVMIKIIGVGMATAILIDVTLVRMVLVPAAIAAFGAANWYHPHWLRRRTAEPPPSRPTVHV